MKKSIIIFTILIVVAGLSYFLSRPQVLCNTKDSQKVCRVCECSRGSAVAGLEYPACPDGSAPKCTEVSND